MKNETKKCKFCQTDIPAKAKVCPNCKRTLKSPGCLMYILSFIIVVGVIIAIASNTNSSIQREVSGTSSDAEYITLEEYNKITIGMTYAEVKEIVGSAGTLTSEAGTGDFVMQIYTWYGNGVAGSNANVTFTNGEASAKAQVGLK